MATLVTHTIKPAGGGDYSDLNAWESNEQRNLVSADEIEQAECYSGGNLSSGSTLALAGWTTDSDRYVEITVASGHEHAGVKDTNKAYIDVSTGSTITIASGSTFFVYLRKLQIINSGESSGSRWCLQTSGQDRMYRCLLIMEAGGEAVARYGPYSHVANNCLFLANLFGNNAGVQCITNVPAGTLYIRNCTIIARGIGDGMVTSLNGNIISENNYIKGSPSYNGANITKGSHDATNDTGATDANLPGLMEM